MLFIDDMVTYAENTMESTKKVTKTMSKLV